MNIYRRLQMVGEECGMTILDLKLMIKKNTLLSYYLQRLRFVKLEHSEQPASSLSSPLSQLQH